MAAGQEQVAGSKKASFGPASTLAQPSDRFAPPGQLSRSKGKSRNSQASRRGH